MIRHRHIVALLLSLANVRLHAATTRLEHDAAQGLTTSGGGALSRCLTLDSGGFVSYLDTACVAAFADLTGSASCAQLPALTGDTTTSAGNCATTTVKVNGSTPGGTCTNQFVRSTNSSAVPTCASIVAADLPNPAASALGGVRSYAVVGSQWLTSISTSGVPASSQPAFTDISGTASTAQIPSLAASKINSGQIALAQGGTNADLSATGGASQFLKQASSGAAITVARPACADLSNAAASCSTDTTSASNISSGTLGAARLPNPAATTLGGIESYAAVANQWINAISTSGVPSSTQPSVSNLSDTKTGSGNVVLATSPTITDATINQASNNDTVITSTRATDTSPTGNFMLFKNAAAGTLWQVDITGSLAAGSIPNARLVTAAAGTGTCTNQVVTVENSASAPTCTTITSAYTSGTFSPTAHNLLSASHGDTTAASAVRGDGIFAIGGTSWQRLAHSSATGGYFKWNGTDIVGSTGAAAGTGTCTNQTATVLNADAAPTCTTLTSAYVDNTVVTTGAGKFVVDANGTATKVHNVSTAGSGLPPVLNVTDLSAQSASISATTLYTTTASGAGLYRVCYVAKVTTAATTSSTLGPFQIKYTDSTDSTTPSEPSLAVTGVNQATTNSTTTVVGGCYIAWAKASTAVQYVMGYTSSGATAMVYNLHMTTEAVGVAP